MSKFHLMHCLPHRRMHGLNSYKEVIDTVAWGLQQLGHQVSYAANRFDASATNIVFGGQVLAIEIMQQMPRDTIIYNFEPMRNASREHLREEVRYQAENFAIWEYSPANLQIWSEVGRNDIRIVPVGYAPILSRIAKAPEQDIDVLIYAMTGEHRLQAFHRIAQAGLATLFVCGIYGAKRDDLISRSKLVLNINLMRFAKIFEVVRVSYLFANRKAVIADLDPQTQIEDDIRSVVRFTTLDTIVDDCLDLLIHDDKRMALEEAGFASIRQRDIRPILERALA